MHVHILGICGTFMGGIAAIARAAGHRVTGSDRNVYPPMSTQLAALGVEVIEGFDAAQLEPAPDIVVVGNVMTLPTTTMSGAGSSCAASKPSITSTPSAASCVLMGG